MKTDTGYHFVKNRYAIWGLFCMQLWGLFLVFNNFDIARAVTNEKTIRPTSHILPLVLKNLQHAEAYAKDVCNESQIFDNSIS